MPSHQHSKAIPLDDNEGIYVRDCKTGKVRAVCGKTYMLNHNEELWEKDLPPTIEDLLSSAKDPLADRSDRGSKPSGVKRDKTRVVTFRVPHNAAVQIYDYKEKQARVVFGPELVMLGPDEQFTLLSLSGGKPKQPNQIKSLCLLLGPVSSHLTVVSSFRSSYFVYDTASSDTASSFLVLSILLLSDWVFYM